MADRRISAEGTVFSTTGSLSRPLLFTRSDGSVLHLYQPNLNEGTAVTGQLADRNGAPTGPTLAFDFGVTLRNLGFSADMLVDGRMVVAAVEQESFDSTYNGYRTSIVVSIFNADGSVSKTAFNVGAVNDYVSQPIVVANSDGSFTITWMDNDIGLTNIYTQHFGANGNSIGGPFFMGYATPPTNNSPPVTNTQSAADTASVSSGVSLTTWTLYDAVAEKNVVWGRLHDADGAIGAAFEVADGLRTEVTALSNNRFLVTWLVSGEPGHVMGRIIQDNGTAGQPFKLATDDLELFFYLETAALPYGGFVAIWHAAGADHDGDGSGIRGQIFDENGAKVGSDFGVNTTIQGNQRYVDVSVHGDGRIEVNFLSGTETELRSVTLDKRTEAIEFVGTASKDYALGTKFHDTLSGRAGADRLHGENGKDALIGGKGNDILSGGKLSDTFIFATKHGQDRIIDFEATGRKHDVLDLSDVRQIKDFADLKANHMERHGKDVWIEATDADRIVLVNTKLADLDKSDFDF